MPWLYLSFRSWISLKDRQHGLFCKFYFAKFLIFVCAKPNSSSTSQMAVCCIAQAFTITLTLLDLSFLCNWDHSQSLFLQKHWHLNLCAAPCAIIICSMCCVQQPPVLLSWTMHWHSCHRQTDFTITYTEEILFLILDSSGPLLLIHLIPKGYTVTGKYILEFLESNCFLNFWRNNWK